MKIQFAAATTLLMGLSFACAQSEDSFKAAYDGNRLFELRADVSRSGSVPLFYKGALAAAANRVSTAVSELHEVVDAAPRSDQAYEAHDILGNLFFRNGMYQEAFQELQAALKQRPDAADAKQMLPLATVLNDFPAMKIASLRSSSVQIEPNSVFIPITLNGHDGEFFFDTGAGISLMGESEAKALGIPVQAVEGKMGDASGKGVSGLRVALVRDLMIGGLHLENVPFVVVSDAGEPWNTLPTKRKGIIGIPVLLAMRTIRWRPTGSFELGLPAGALDLSTCNVLFHNANPVTQARIDGKDLDFTIDTGAETTDLNPPFAKTLPLLVKTGTPEKHSIEGLGGTTEGQSVFLPSVTLRFGGGTAVLKPAHVFTEQGNGSWAAGNLGMDLLSQSSSFTLDFAAMTLRLQ